MSDKEGILRLQPSGRWAVCRPGHDPAGRATGALIPRVRTGTSAIVSLASASPDVADPRNDIGPM
jgi:hypothetical protein